MSRALIIRRAGPAMSVQDRGRPGLMAFGLSRGGAADQLALDEGAALLGQKPALAAIEMAGAGGEFEAGEDLRIALTGAPMRVSIDGSAVAWNASHALPAGARLSIGAAESGTYGYLHVGGGIATEPLLGARSAHVAAGLGALLSAGDRLPVGEDPRPGETGMKIEPERRFEGGIIRVVPSLQTALFPEAEIARFEATDFRRDPRANRMGVRLLADGPGFQVEGGLTVLSEVVVPGDIQIAGDGRAFVLLGECQTTGGYPRIGSVLPSDLPRVAQAQGGAPLRFRFITLEEGVAAERREAKRRAGLRAGIRPLVRDPRFIHDLLSYQLISGVTAGDDFQGN